MRAKTSFQALFFTLRGTWPTVTPWPRVSIESANTAGSFLIVGRPFLAALQSASFALHPKQDDHYCACVYAIWSAELHCCFRVHFFDPILLMRKTSPRRNAGCAKGTSRSCGPVGEDFECFT